MLSSTCQRGKTCRTIHHLWQHRPSAIDGMNWRKMCGAVGAWSLRDGFTEVIRPLSKKADCFYGCWETAIVKGKVDGFSSFASSNTLSRSNFLQGWKSRKHWVLATKWRIIPRLFSCKACISWQGALCESQIQHWQLLLVHSLHFIDQPRSSPWSSLNRQPSNFHFHCSFEKAKEKLL